MQYGHSNPPVPAINSWEQDVCSKYWRRVMYGPRTPSWVAFAKRSMRRRQRHEGKLALRTPHLEAEQKVLGVTLT